MKSFESIPDFPQGGALRRRMAMMNIAWKWGGPIIAWAVVMSMLVALVAIVLNPPY